MKTLSLSSNNLCSFVGIEFFRFFQIHHYNLHCAESDSSVEEILISLVKYPSCFAE